MATLDKKGGVDIERGNDGQQLYPGMLEDPKLRWAFIRKVYSILCFQLLLTFGVSVTMCLIHPVRKFMGTPSGFYVLLAFIVVTLILITLMNKFSQHHPWNFILLFLFTLGFSFMVGAASTQSKGEAVLLAAGLTLLVTVGLTLFTFVAAKRGCDFKFLWPFLFCSLLLLIAFGLIRIIFPMGKILQQVMGFFGALVFSGFIIYDTDSIIKRFNYDEFIDAAMCLFLDVLNLFLALLGLGGGNR